MTSVTRAGEGEHLSLASLKDMQDPIFGASVVVRLKAYLTNPQKNKVNGNHPALSGFPHPTDLTS